MMTTVDKDNKVFDLCIIVGDSYESTLAKLIIKKSHMIIYVGEHNEMFEKYISENWAGDDLLSVSTFQEPYSFFHASLADSILVLKDDLSSENIEQITSEMKMISYPVDNLTVV